MVMWVRGVVLPEREERSFVIDGEVLRVGAPAAGDLVGEGWLVPGLVDVHTHPGAENSRDTFTDAALREHLLSHRDAGVLLVRTPGTAQRIPDWVAEDPALPRVRSAGRWLATPGRFYPGYGRDISEPELPTAAVEEASSADGWCKVIVDWQPDEPPLSVELLAQTVADVHAVGGKVAAHCQTAEGCRTAVEAGVDSLEHGMHLDPGLLDRMAAQGTALVPTLVAFAGLADGVRAQPQSRFREWFLDGWDHLPALVGAAYESGVTVLAGTDSTPFGRVAAEVEWLARAGLPKPEAVAAASWGARSWLGLPGLVDGAPADLLVYDSDPTQDPSILTRPRLAMLRGRVIRPRSSRPG